MKKLLVTAAITTMAVLPSFAQPTVSYKTIKIDGLNIFYREAGDKTKPVILLLHGFPASSHMYRNLINDLSASYHLIAPDYPGFGQSSAPAASAWNYSFDNLAMVMNHFIDALGLTKFSLYVQDYGGPVGFRIASKRPELIESLIIQNANAYAEGWGTISQPLTDYFKQPNAQTEKIVRGLLSFEATKAQYTQGAADLNRLSPDGYITDQYYLDRPGNDLIQLALFRDYATNVGLYDSWHAYFRTQKPPALVISGKNDPIFIEAGARAYAKDLPQAQISLLNGGHFVLEEKHEEAAALINQFLLSIHHKTN